MVNNKSQDQALCPFEANASLTMPEYSQATSTFIIKKRVIRPPMNGDYSPGANGLPPVINSLISKPLSFCS